jgi:hypothetical protein
VVLKGKGFDLTVAPEDSSLVQTLLLPLARRLQHRQGAIQSGDDGSTPGGFYRVSPIAAPGIENFASTYIGDLRENGFLLLQAFRNES